MLIDPGRHAVRSAERKMITAKLQHQQILAEEGYGEISRIAEILRASPVPAPYASDRLRSLSFTAFETSATAIPSTTG